MIYAATLHVGEAVVRFCFHVPGSPQGHMGSRASFNGNLLFLFVYDTSRYIRVVSSHHIYIVTLMQIVIMPALLMGVGIFFLYFFLAESEQRVHSDNS